jgi:hypothetical protein
MIHTALQPAASLKLTTWFFLLNTPRSSISMPIIKVRKEAKKINSLEIISQQVFITRKYEELYSGSREITNIR